MVPIKDLNHLVELLSTDGIDVRRYPGSKLTIEQKTSRLFHYTKFETFSKYIWPNKNLRAGDIGKLNDLFERYKIVTSSLPSQAALMYAFEIIRNAYRQISFTMDFDSFKEGCMSPLMWAYYADCTNGVCIEFDPAKIHFSAKDICRPINYVNGPSREIVIPESVKSINDLHSFLLDKADEIFFTKSNDWERENEFKVLTTREYTDFDDGAIKCVYVASYDSETCYAVEKIVGDEIPVKFFHLDKKSLPHVTDTKSYREKILHAKNNPDNFLNAIQNKAEDTYLRLKDNPDADLSVSIFEY